MRGPATALDKSVAAREIMLLGALAEARAAAAGAGIELAPLKGAALLELGIYRPGERGMSDVDLLLRPKDLEPFERLLSGLGYSPMPNSADAWVKASSGEAPPVILDLHTGLWHIKNTEEFFRWGLEPGPSGLSLSLPDLFLHAAAHPLLHHGELTPRALEDCARIAAAAPGEGGKFWALAARKAEVYGLRPAVWPVIKRLGLEERTARPFAPRGLEKVKAAFFEKAARKRSAALEYLLPVLHRPAMAAGYLVPDKRFMLRRYGSASPLSYAFRPLRLLLSILRRG